MKIVSRFLMASVGAVALILASCESTPAAPAATPAPTPKPAAAADDSVETDAPFATLYNKVLLDLTPKGIVAAVGTGIDKSGRFDLALQKAQLDAQVNVAKAFETKVEGLQKNFAESLSGNTGDPDKAEINETFQTVSKAVEKKTLNGVQALSAPRQIKDKSTGAVTVGIIMGIDPKAVNTSMLNELKGTDPKLYERFRSSQAFTDLQKEMDNYDKSSAAPAPTPAPAAN